jgi:hypothetical protein
MESLTPVLSSYVDVSKRINDLNAQLAELRDTRRSIELDLGILYATKQLPDKLELRTSNMTFVVKRPNQWKKGWSLSKKELAHLLNEILPEHGEDVMKDIERRQSSSLVSDDFGFELRSKTSDSS